jgi:hypothetical protein
MELHLIANAAVNFPDGIFTDAVRDKRSTMVWLRTPANCLMATAIILPQLDALPEADGQCQ